MHKVLRSGMEKAFAAAISRRWPGFAVKKAVKIFPKNAGELCLTWKPCNDLELVFSIYPNPKAYWSSFMISFLWSRTGNFEFIPSRGTLRAPPPDYDIQAALRRGLPLEKADIAMGVLWHTGRGIDGNSERKPFKDLDYAYNPPYFPLKSPLFTFDAATQGPEDYQRLQAAENAMTVGDSTAMATPVIEEICDEIAIHIWPFVEQELIPFACSAPFKAEPGPEQA